MKTTTERPRAVNRDKDCVSCSGEGDCPLCDKDGLDDTGNRCMACHGTQICPTCEPSRESARH